MNYDKQKENIKAKINLFPKLNSIEKHEKMKKLIVEMFSDEALTLDEKNKYAKLYLQCSWDEGYALGFHHGLEEAINGIKEEERLEKMKEVDKNEN